MPRPFQNQSSLLHIPARMTETIQQYIDQKQTEHQQLDFKSISWKKGEGLEAAKDVAAFANNLGGDIVIGIDDKGDCANGWNAIPNGELSTIIKNIQQWLILHLRPHEFGEIVEIVPVKAKKADHSVLVISIPPSVELVGIEHRESDRISFQFPIRTGRRTRWLSYEELMNRASITTRGMFIRLKELIDEWGGKPPIQFSSPVVVIAGDEHKPLPVRDGFHCYLKFLTEETITVEMQGSSKPVKGRLRPRGANYELSSDPVTVPPDCKLTIPLEFIRAAWRDPRDFGLAPLLSLALEADLTWNGQTWVLLTGKER